ncbi:MAG: RNA-guided endonuclease InsQ/TnpB family protein [Brevinematia bacterium]
MLLRKKVLSIRISGKERKKKIRNFLLDLAHFKNILVIFIKKYYELYSKTLLNQSILYGLLSKNYSGNYKEEFEKALENIESSEELKELLEKLKAQKEKIGNSHFIQYIIRQVVKNFMSFFKALRSYRENPEKFKSEPKPPKPKKLKYLMNFSAEANANTFKIENNNLVIKLRKGQYLKVRLPKDFPYRVSSVRLKFFGDDLYVDVVYEREEQRGEVKEEYRAGIDIGLDELLCVVSENPKLKSFIISGKEIKAFNQWFNKERAKLRSQIDHLKNKIKSRSCENTGELKRKLRELEIKEKILSAHRKRWMNNNLHKISKRLVELLYETGHKVIYIGKNALESKNGINLGKKTNQEFVLIPFRRLIELIKYKAQRLGMEVVEVDESYTSKTSPFADIVRVQETKDKSLCQGERKGNTFKDIVVNKMFHADLVGALNILRVGAKLLKLSFYDNLKILFVKLCNPIKLKLIDLLYKVSPESLWIGGSRQDFYPAGWTEKQGHLAMFGE